MKLTSREQALLTVALDKYLSKVNTTRECDDMWAELYDEVIAADIDDVGEEYDPFDDDVELDWDVLMIRSWAADLDEGADKHGTAEDVSYVISDELALTMYDALGERFAAEWQQKAEEIDIDWVKEEQARVEAARDQFEEALNDVPVKKQKKAS